jgi:hypothetical protein
MLWSITGLQCKAVYNVMSLALANKMPTTNAMCGDGLAVSVALVSAISTTAFLYAMIIDVCIGGLAVPGGVLRFLCRLLERRLVTFAATPFQLFCAIFLFSGRLCWYVDPLLRYHLMMNIGGHFFLLLLSSTLVTI